MTSPLENVVSAVSNGISLEIRNLKAFKNHKEEDEKAIADEALKWFDEEELPRIREFCKSLMNSVEYYEKMKLSEDSRELHGKILSLVRFNKDSVSTETLADGVGQAIAQYLFE